MPVERVKIPTPNRENHFTEANNRSNQHPENQLIREQKRGSRKRTKNSKFFEASIFNIQTSLLRCSRNTPTLVVLQYSYEFASSNFPYRKIWQNHETFYHSILISFKTYHNAALYWYGRRKALSLYRSHIIASSFLTYLLLFIEHFFINLLLHNQNSHTNTTSTKLLYGTPSTLALIGKAN